MTPTGGNHQFELGIASRAIPGESEIGDMCVIEHLEDGLLIAVVDGLGHGAEAASVAKAAAEIISSHAEESVISILRRCHDRLKDTRGAVMSVAEVNSRDETITWLAVGNIEGMLVRDDPRAVPPYEAIVQRSGVVGYRIPPLHASMVSLMKGDTIVMTTDGIATGFVEALRTAATAQEIADTICSRYAKENDDALVLVARYLRTHHE
jgi:serine phosphatase RsbU (regulator of sigma subunit)